MEEELKREEEKTMSNNAVYDVYKTATGLYVIEEVCQMYNVGDKGDYKTIRDHLCYKVNEQDLNYIEKQSSFQEIKLVPNIVTIFDLQLVLSFTVYVDNKHDNKLYILNNLCSKYNIEAASKRIIDGSTYCNVTEKDIAAIEEATKKEKIILKRKYVEISLEDEIKPAQYLFIYFYDYESNKSYIRRDMYELATKNGITIEGEPKIIGGKNCYSVTEKELKNIEIKLGYRGIEQLLRPPFHIDIPASHVVEKVVNDIEEVNPQNKNPLGVEFETPIRYPRNFETPIRYPRNFETPIRYPRNFETLKYAKKKETTLPLNVEFETPYKYPRNFETPIRYPRNFETLKYAKKDEPTLPLNLEFETPIRYPRNFETPIRYPRNFETLKYAKKDEGSLPLDLEFETPIRYPRNFETLKYAKKDEGSLPLNVEFETPYKYPRNFETPIRYPRNFETPYRYPRNFETLKYVQMEDLVLIYQDKRTGAIYIPTDFVNLKAETTTIMHKECYITDIADIAELQGRRIIIAPVFPVSKKDYNILICNNNGQLFISQDILEELGFYIEDPHRIIVNKEIYEEITEADIELIEGKESDNCHINIIVKQIAPKRG